MIRLIHAADLHLDSPFAGLRPEQAQLRRAEQRALLAELTAACNENECDLVLLSGDLFDGKHVYQDTVEALAEALAGCQAQVLIAPGNHDCLSAGSPYRTARWPDNVRIFDEQTIRSVTLEALGCRVYGCGFLQEHCGALLEGFTAEEDGLRNLMVLHGDACGGTDYNPITREQIAASKLDYLALGHVHKRGSLREGGTLCAWPGCMMGRGFDECGEKGVLLVTLDGPAVRTEFVPLSARRYKILELPIGDDPVAEIEALLPEDTARDIYRIILTAEHAPLDVPALQAQLEPRFFALELIDRTVPPLALWADAGEDSLKGQFLSRLKERYENADADERPTVLLAARYAVSIFEGREVPTL